MELSDPSAAATTPPAAAPPGTVGGLRQMHPAYFAMAMATGIVSVACLLVGFRTLAVGMFWLNVGVYAALWVLTVVRVIRYPGEVVADLTSHSRGVGFFTTIAATCVLGTQFLLVGGLPRVATGLWVAGIALWAGLTYAVFTALTVRRHKPTLQRGINGTWLLAVVATQSMAVLAAVLAARMPQPARLQLNFVALSLWLLGGTVYVWLISLIFYRYTFLPFEPADLGPAYWINMGAMAISTLAGSLLVLAAPQAPLLQSMLPFLKGFSVLYWATGSWWIPLLVALAVWRYVLRRFPVRFDAGYWGAVFPLGMYSVATHELATALQLGFLLPLATVFFWLALAAWALVAAGAVRSAMAP
jgi:tellurite resistance protein TehA-like permease